MAIRAITFDFWCTLFRDAHKEERKQLRIEALHTLTGASATVIEEALAAVWQEFSRHHIEEQRTLLPADAVRMTAQELGVTFGEEAFGRLTDLFATAIIEHSPVPIEGALEAVKGAAERVPVGLISDTGVSPGSSLKAVMDRNGFSPHFSALVFSDEIGVSKPRPQMFEAAARSLGVLPQDLLHIGDLEPTDVAGAHAIGAKAALFTADNGKYVETTVADYVFPHWNDFIRRLPEILDHLAG